jgi:hypothetical protein
VFSSFMIGFTVAVILYVLLVVAICTLCGRRRGVPEAVAFLGLVLLAGGVSFLLTYGLRNGVGDLICRAVLAVLGAEADDFLAASPSGEAGVRQLVSFAVAPILFFLLFLLVGLLLRLAVGIPVHCLLRKQAKAGKETAAAEAVAVEAKAGAETGKGKQLSWPGLAMGFCGGVLIALLTLTPLCGYMMTAAHTVDALLATGAQQTDVGQDMLESLHTDGEEVQAAVEAVETNPAVWTVNALLGRTLFTGLTSGSGQAGEAVVPAGFEAEMCHIFESVGYGMQVYQWSLDQDEDSWEMDAEDRASFQALYDALFASDWLTEVGAETVSQLALAWSEGESCMGLERPTVDSVAEPVLEEALALLSEETPTLLTQDMSTVLDMLEELVNSGLLSSAQSGEARLAQVGRSGLLGQVSATLQQNDHLAPLVQAFHTMSVRLVATVMESELLRDGQYDDTLDQIAGTLTDVLDLSPAEREATIRQAVQESFQTHDIDVPEDVAVILAEQAIQSLGEDGVITGQEMREYLLAHAEETETILENSLTENIIEDLS